jgi:hypothetical protein
LRSEFSTFKRRANMKKETKKKPASAQLLPLDEESLVHVCGGDTSNPGGGGGGPIVGTIANPGGGGNPGGSVGKEFGPLEVAN